MLQPNGQQGSHIGLITQTSTTTDSDLLDTTVPQIYPQFLKITAGNTCIMGSRGNRGAVATTGGLSSTTNRKWIREGIPKLHKM